MIDGKSITRKLVGSDDERAVSPVIGVILMVAITVILAAVIAAFVLDMSPGSETMTASATIDGGGTDTVDITISDSGNAEYIVLVADGTGTVVDSSDTDGGSATAAEPANTGATYTVTSDTSNPQGSFLGSDDAFKSSTYEVWAVSEDLSGGDTLDDAESSLELGEFELD